MSLQCAGGASRIIVLRRDRASGAWNLLGSVLTGATAADAGFNSFAASELVENGGRRYLLVCPAASDLYKGPVVTLGLGASDLSFAGACGYVDGLETGIIEGQLFRAAPQVQGVRDLRDVPLTKAASSRRGASSPKPGSSPSLKRQQEPGRRALR